MRPRFAARLAQLEAENLTDQVLRYSLHLGRLEHLLGINFVSSEELTNGQTWLARGVKSLRRSPLSFPAELIDALNQLGATRANREQYEQALIALLHAKQTYKDLKKDAESNPLPETRTKAWWEEVETLHTSTVFFMAQVYGHQGNSVLAARYCQMCLSRQTETDYDPQEWAKNAIGLAFFYSSEDRFADARYCLAAATAVLPELKTTPKGQCENMDAMIAALCRAWGHFYLKYLQKSRDEQLGRNARSEEYDDVKAADQKLKRGNVGADEEKHADGDEGGGTSGGRTGESLPQSYAVFFRGLDLPAPKPEDCPLATAFVAARKLFLAGQGWFQKALQWYELDGFVSDHIEIMQDFSQLYKCLITFEDDISRKCKMHKRRLDMLECIIPELNAKVYIEFYQQLCDEVASIYMQMAELKGVLNHDRKHGPERNKASMKINELCLKSVQFYQMWILSFDKEMRTEPSTVEPEHYQCFMGSLFCIARMYGKVSLFFLRLVFVLRFTLQADREQTLQIFHTDPKTYCLFLNKSLESYKKVIAFAERHGGEAEEAFAGELGICREMVELLPLKMSRVMATGSFEH